MASEQSHPGLRSDERSRIKLLPGKDNYGTLAQDSARKKLSSLSKEERAVKYAFDAYESLFSQGPFRRSELESLVNEYLRIVKGYTK